MTTFPSEDLRLRTDTSSRVGLGVIFIGMAAFCAYSVVDGAGFSAIVGACICIGAWLYYATLEIVIGPNIVVVRRFWRAIWQSKRSSVSAKIARGGEAKTHRCLRLTSEEESRPFDMLQSLFGKNALEQAQLMLGSQ
jgi:hypothetical protein